MPCMTSVLYNRPLTPIPEVLEVDLSGHLIAGRVQNTQTWEKKDSPRLKSASAF